MFAGSSHRSFTRIAAVVLATAWAPGAALPSAAAAADDDKDKKAEDEDGDEEETKEGYEPLVLPIFGGSTDIGVMLGATAAVAHLKPGFYPYEWKGSFTVALSLKDGPDTVELPVHYYAVGFDVPGLAGGLLRLFPRVEVRRIVNAGYFGLGNASEVEAAASELPFRRYQYSITWVKLRLNSQIAMGGGFHLWLGASWRYQMPEIYEGSVLEEDAEKTDAEGDPYVRGTEDQQYTEGEIGIVYDSRNHEANPTRGMYHQFKLWAVPGKITGSDLSWSGISLTTRFFVPFAGEYLFLALRLHGSAQFGAVPFTDMSLADLRGVPARRFYGKAQVYGNFELRSFFYRFTVLKQRVGLGLAAFLDTGRVFADLAENPELDGTDIGLKWGAGGGLRIQWGETRIIRADVAYSPLKAELDPDMPVALYLMMDHFF